MHLFFCLDVWSVSQTPLTDLPLILIREFGRTARMFKILNWIGWADFLSINQSINQSIYLSIYLSFYQWMNEWMNEWINQSINQSIKSQCKRSLSNVRFVFWRHWTNSIYSKLITSFWRVKRNLLVHHDYFLYLKET